MSPIRQSNINRDNERAKCRNALSDHIQVTLGILVQPDHIRLNPGKNDPYRWKFMLGEEETFKSIFAKNLSDHSTGVYQLLSYAVGKRFEAVPAQGITSPFQSITPLSSIGTSFTAVIENLNEENARLCTEVEDLKRRLGVETQTRNCLEEENSQMQVSQKNMQSQARKQSAFIGQLKMSISTYCQGIDQVMPLFENLKTFQTEDRGRE